jgi:hypothetical protein
MLHVRSEVLDRLERALRDADIDLVAPTLMATVPSDEADREGTGQTGTAVEEPAPERGETAPSGRSVRPTTERKEPRA